MGKSSTGSLINIDQDDGIVKMDTDSTLINIDQDDGIVKMDTDSTLKIISLDKLAKYIPK